MKARVVIGAALLLVMQVACTASKLVSGVPYFIRLRGGREDCGQQVQEDYLGFFNRTCGSVAPKSVGPWLRDPTKLTWRQWNITIIGETDREQWGYLQNYYPEEWGEAKCVGHLLADPRACTGRDSETATIDTRSERTIFRFVPLSNEEGTYRIIVRSKKGGCNRFLTAFADCSDASVGFTKEDLREGLQRWVITEVGPGPSPTPLPTTSPTDTPLPTETPSPVPIPAPTVAVESSTVTYTSGKVKVMFESIVQADTCTVHIESSNIKEMQSITLEMPSSPQENTAIFDQLRPATEYVVSAFCNSTDGRVSPESVRVTLKTSGRPYDLEPSGPESFCDGLGEIVDKDGKCICDSKDFIPNGKGGCKCKDGLTYDDVLGRCALNTDCSGFAQIIDDRGLCVCKNSPYVIPDGQGGCKCERFMELRDDTCGCKANCPLTDFGTCDCGSYVHFFKEAYNNPTTATLYYMFVGTAGATINATMPGIYEEQLTIPESGFVQSDIFFEGNNSDLFPGYSGEVVSRAIRLQYDEKDKLNAFSVQYFEFSSDMSLVVNGDQMAKEYLVLAPPMRNDIFKDSQDYKDFFSITAVDFDTVVQITPSVDLNTTGGPRLANDMFEVTLEKPGDVVVFASFRGEEVTGSSIVASKPVSVLAGHNDGRIPTELGYADVMFSQLFPVRDFNTEFRVVESGRPKGDYIRVLAAEDGTKVFFDGVLEGTINRGEIVVKDQVGNLVVTSDKPVMVGHFLRGGQDVNASGDPSFTVIPSTEQWLTSYVYATIPADTGEPYENQINIVILESEKDTLRLNGEPLPAPFNSEVKDGYLYANFAIEAGHGTISADVPFLVLLMGIRKDNSYYTFLID